MGTFLIVERKRITVNFILQSFNPTFLKIFMSLAVNLGPSTLEVDALPIQLLKGALNKSSIISQDYKIIIKILTRND